MSGIIYFIPIIIWLLTFLWFATSVKYDRMAWLVPILITAVMFVPILNWIVVGTAVVVIVLIGLLENDAFKKLPLKDNWFNKVFLGYRNE